MIEKILERARAELFNLTFHKSERCKGFNDGIHTVMKIVKEESKNGGWIPCSERMPSEEEMKKAYCRNKYGSEFIVMIEGANRPTTLYRTLDGFWVDDCRNVHEVIAWQPLPPRYEPQKGE